MRFSENAILQFVARQFPWWGNCHFRFIHQTKRLYIYSQNLEKRRKILRDLPLLAASNLGITQLILVQPPHPETVVDCSQKLSQF